MQFIILSKFLNIKNLCYKNLEKTEGNGERKLKGNLVIKVLFWETCDSSSIAIVAHKNWVYDI